MEQQELGKQELGKQKRRKLDICCASEQYTKTDFLNDCRNYTEQDVQDFCDLIKCRFSNYLTYSEKQLASNKITFFIYVECLPVEELIGIGA